MSNPPYVTDWGGGGGGGGGGGHLPLIGGLHNDRGIAIASFSCIYDAQCHQLRLRCLVYTDGISWSCTITCTLLIAMITLISYSK